MKFGDEIKMAKQLCISIQELFDKYLMVDFWNSDEDHEEDVFILSPAVISGTPGKEFPYNPRGVCVFYKRGLCGVHKSSPFECRHYIHGLGDKETHANHREAMESWNNPKAQKRIAELLGRNPVAAQGTFLDILFA